MWNKSYYNLIIFSRQQNIYMHGHIGTTRNQLLRNWKKVNNLKNYFPFLFLMKEIKNINGTIFLGKFKMLIEVHYLHAKT